MLRTLMGVRIMQRHHVSLNGSRLHPTMQRGNAGGDPDVTEVGFKTIPSTPLRTQSGQPKRWLWILPQRIRWAFYVMVHGRNFRPIERCLLRQAFYIATEVDPVSRRQ